ncbi:hypothetical protein SEVIR_6G124700v4 [Setaria viridis]|uniref:Uncharacterized protein n=3 Tax=Setaria TaxID=4554 RepID=A0A368RKK4_SETIT|nr:uncharacterized protein LOC101783829 [Setaria italica]XP_034601219.1 uncharacterized protein LOC117861793 [Setaria viridis]RCV30682.1 hypothetical protein SETIT_6G114700v2 [Setaria italica]TKW09780.1 hypothetical protein SEVIR_6G124700v2 [Setaria viridis]
MHSLTPVAKSKTSPRRGRPKPSPPPPAQRHGQPARRPHAVAASPPQHPPPALPPSAPPAAATCAADAGNNGKAAAAKNRGVQKLLKSAFKRGEHAPGASSSGSAAASGGHAGEEACLAAAQDLSRSSSSSAGASSARKGRRGGGGGDNGSANGERSSHDSLDLEGSKNTKAAAALRNAKIGSSYEAFPWERKMTDLLPVPNSSRFLSLLMLPQAADESQTRYLCLEDTLARADAWLMSSQSSGVPIVQKNVQIEPLLTKISGDTALSSVNMGSLGDLANVATMSLYGFEDYHGVDIGIVRAVRLWYAPVAGELALEIKLQPGDTRLGFAISRTEEGFIYVSSVADESTPGVASTRSGLLELYRRARRASRLLVVSRVGRDKVLPWAVSAAGDVRCADTVSLSQLLSLHRHALRPVTLGFLMWEDLSAAALLRSAGASRPSAAAAVMLPAQAAAGDDGEASSDEIAFDGDGPEIVLSKDSDDCSFRFQHIGLPDSWL